MDERVMVRGGVGPEVPNRRTHYSSMVILVEWASEEVLWKDLVRQELIAVVDMGHCLGMPLMMMMMDVSENENIGAAN